MKRKTTAAQLARQLNLPKSRTIEASIKAQLIAEVIKEARRRGVTHARLAERAGLARTTVTGILSGSLQKITIDRILRLVEAAGLEAEVRVRRAA